MKRSMIVWHPIRHDSRLYHPLGNYTAHQIDNYILISSLGISGTDEQARGNSIAILDTGYILVRLKLINRSLAKIERHLNSLKNLQLHLNPKNLPRVKENRIEILEIQTNLFITHVAALAEQERTNMINSWENICRQRQQMSRVYRWAVENFPHSSSQWFTQGPRTRY